MQEVAGRLAPVAAPEPRAGRRPSRLRPGSLGGAAAGAGAAVALAGSLVLGAGPALAAGTSGFSSSTTVASADSTALDVTLPNFALTSGTSRVTSGSEGDVTAEGAGLLAPSHMGVARAAAAPGQSRSTPSSCSGPSLPRPPAPFGSLLSLSAACGSAAARSASVMDASARATGTSVRLSLDLAPLLDQVVKAGSPLATALEGVLGKLPPLPTGGATVSSLLARSLAQVGSHQVLEVTAGQATASTSMSRSGWAATSEAAGGIVSLLPGAGSNGAPLVRVVVGGSTARASVGRPPSTGGTDRPRATDTPALVSVQVDAPGTGSKTYSVAPGQSFTVLKGTPLESTVSVGAGSVSTTPAGGESATASAVTLQLARGIGASGGSGGGIKILLAASHAEAAVTTTGGPATPNQPPVASHVANATVPHTGLPWAGAAPALAGAGALGAGLLLWPKRRGRAARRPPLPRPDTTGDTSA